MAELLRLAYAIRIRCVVSALKTGATVASKNPPHRINNSKPRCLASFIVTHRLTGYPARAFILAVPPHLGSMECWSGGVMSFRPNTPVVQHSNTPIPILHHSNLHSP